MHRFLNSLVRFRVLIVAVAVGIIAVGVAQLRSSPVDVLPEFTPPYAEIQTEALGLSAEEVEQLITVPLEADLLNGVEGVEVIRSESVPGLSSIVLVFARGTDVYRARQLVEERLTQAHALPNVSKPPTLLQPLSSSNRVLMIGLSSDQLSLIEQSVLARWTIRPQLMGVPGVANVSVWGMRDQQLQVQVDPAQLRTQRVTLSQVVTTAGNAQVVSPLTFLEASTPGTGGFVETPQQRLQVRHLLEKMADPNELAAVPVQGTRGRLTLGDVSNVTVGHQPLIGDAVVAGGSGLLLVVEKFPGTSATEVTDGVEDALEKLRPGLTGLTTDTSVHRPADFVREALGNLGLGVLLAAAVALLALVALRVPWRALVIVVFTVPLSMITAALVISLSGGELNALALGGVAGGAALVVDQAVASTQQLWRRSLTAPAPPAPVGGDPEEGVGPRRPAVLVPGLVALLPVVPVAVLGGRPGIFFAPLAVAYASAVVAAMIVAVTVAPALASLLAPRRRGAVQEPAWWARLTAFYLAVLSRFGRHPRTAVLSTVGLVLVALLVLPLLSTPLLPDFRDRNLVVRLQGQPGVSNQRMTEQTTELVNAMQSVAGVAAVAAHIGRAVTGDRVVNVNSADVWVRLDPTADYDVTLSAVQTAAAAVPELAPEVLSSSTQDLRDIGALRSGENIVRGRGLDLLTGLSRPVAVRLFGQDPGVLEREAGRVRELLTTVPGVVDPQVISTTKQPTIEIEVDMRRAQAHGVTPGDVRRAEATLLQGIQVGSVFEDQRVFDVIVQGIPATRRSEADVRRLLIDRPDGGHVALADVATVRTVPTPAVIRRDAVSRRVDVVVGIDGRSPAAVADDIEARLASLDLPLEYHGEVLTQSTAQEVGRGGVIGTAVAAALAAVLLFQAAFRSWRLAALLTVTVPAALAGGVVAAVFTDRELSLGSLLGLLGVFAMVVGGGIRLIREFQAPRTSAGIRDGVAPSARPARDSTVAAAGDRLQPVLVSVLAVAAAAVPFVLLGPRAGLELIHPLAVVLLGGLTTTAFVLLFVLPALYLQFGERRRAEPDVGRSAEGG